MSTETGPRPEFPRPALRDPGELMQHVTPTLRGENITSMDVDEETRAYLGPAATAMDTLYQSVQQVIDARNAAAKNRAWSEAEQIVQVADFAQKVEAKASRLVDSTLKNLGTSIAAIEETLRAPITTGANTPIASDICQHLRSLETGERMALLTNAIKEGDHITMGAVLGRPAYLSGITKEMQAVLTEQFNRARFPAVAKRLSAMKAAHEKLSNAGSLFLATVEKAQGVSWSVSARLKAEQQAASKALAFGA